MNRGPRLKLLSAALFASLLPLTAHAQQEGLNETQTLLRADSRSSATPTLATTTIEVNNRPAPLQALTAVRPSGVQIALLIDEGLRRTSGLQLPDIKQFIRTLQPGTEIFVGYMQNGRVVADVPFTTNLTAAAEGVRMVMGVPGQSASPYFCLSDFVKNWPGTPAVEGPRTTGNKARFVIMLTNGVDPYNGSTSVMNQDSPYVKAAADDAERAGVVVSSIYFPDAGVGGNSASFSGQSYLQQVADATGGQSYYQGTITPVAILPFFKQFQHDISETYVATFQANAGSHPHGELLRLKVKTSIPALKLRHAEAVRPGNMEGQPNS